MLSEEATTRIIQVFVFLNFHNKHSHFCCNSIVGYDIKRINESVILQSESSGLKICETFEDVSNVVSSSNTLSYFVFRFMLSHNEK
jgi:hypothetical protein